MKIRNGFVSNSSSSSFVVLLPKNFLETVDYKKIAPGDDEFPEDEFKKLLEKVVEDNGIWKEEISDFDEEDYEFADILDDILRPYIIAQIDTSSEAGQIIVVDRDEVQKILDKTA